MTAMRCLLGFCVFTLCSLHVNALDISGGDASAYVGLQGRYFFNEPVLAEQDEHGASASAYLETYIDFNDRQQRLAFTGFARHDFGDEDRSHTDIRELYWWANFDKLELYIGARKIFWGVTESVHLVDVINQTDSLENIDGEEKLGQPMIQLVSAQDWGTIEAFVLPVFRERAFPGEKGRLRAPVLIVEEALYQDEDNDNHIDYALRWSHYAGIWDLGASYFNGTDRNPLFLPRVEGDQLIALQPYYTQIQQAGLDLQATIDAWLLKAEMIAREEQDGPQNTALAAGIEYTLYTIANTNADLGLVMEYQFDDRRGIRETISQNDLVVGARWALNDLDGSEMLVLLSQDLDYGNQFFSIELTRRINDAWKVEAELRSFLSTDSESPDTVFAEDDFLQIELRRYF